MSTRAFEQPLIPSVTAAAMVYAGDKWVIPMMYNNSTTAACDPDNVLMVTGIRALMIYLGVLVGDYLNQMFFRR